MCFWNTNTKGPILKHAKGTVFVEKTHAVP